MNDAIINFYEIILNFGLKIYSIYQLYNIHICTNHKIVGVYLLRALEKKSFYLGPRKLNKIFNITNQLEVFLKIRIHYNKNIISSKLCFFKIVHFRYV